MVQPHQAQNHGKLSNNGKDMMGKLINVIILGNTVYKRWRFISILEYSITIFYQSQYIALFIRFNIWWNRLIRQHHRHIFCVYDINVYIYIHIYTVMFDRNGSITTRSPWPNNFKLNITANPSCWTTRKDYTMYARDISNRCLAQLFCYLFNMSSSHFFGTM